MCRSDARWCWASSNSAYARSGASSVPHSSSILRSSESRRGTKSRRNELTSVAGLTISAIVRFIVPSHSVLLRFILGANFGPRADGDYTSIGRRYSFFDWGFSARLTVVSLALFPGGAQKSPCGFLIRRSYVHRGVWL